MKNTTIAGLFDAIKRAFAPFLTERSIKEVESWDGAASNYPSTESYCNACLINLNTGDPANWVQNLAKLPVREAGDAKDVYVLQAIHAAAGGNGIQAVTKPDGVEQAKWDGAVKSAANELIAAYAEADEQAPDAVYKIAGKEPPAKNQALADSTMTQQIVAQLEQLQATQGQYVTPIDLYHEDDGSMFMLCAVGGKLYRIAVTVSGDAATLGEMKEIPLAAQQVRTSVSIVRQSDGSARWIAQAATAVLNRSGEIDSRALFDAFIKRAQETNTYPVLDFFHLENRCRLGVADYLARDDAVYIASGTFDDTDLARSAQQSLEAERSYWGTSIQFLPIQREMAELVEGVSVPVYVDGINTFVSILPESRAASLFTTVSTEVKRMKPEVYDALVKLVGETHAKRIADSSDETNRTIAEQNLVNRQTGTADQAAASSDKPIDTAPGTTQTQTLPEVLDQPLTIDESAMAEIARMTAESPAFKALQDAVAALTTAVAAIDLKPIQQSVQSLDERLKLAERTDEQKRQQWQNDQSARGRQIVITRPSVARAETDAKPSPAQIAEQTLAGMKTLQNKQNNGGK